MRQNEKLIETMVCHCASTVYQTKREKPEHSHTQVCKNELNEGSSNGHKRLAQENMQ